MHKLITGYDFDWPNINTLDLQFDFISSSDYQLVDTYYLYEMRPDNRYISFLSRFPRICHISANERHSYIEEIIKFGSFFGNLQTLIYNQRIKLDLTRFIGSNLTFLYLESDITDEDLETIHFIDPTPLRYLVLKNITSRNFWLMFDNSLDKRNVTFPDLQLLGLGFSKWVYRSNVGGVTVPSRSYDSKLFQMHFPAIKYLFLDNCRYDDSIMDYATHFKILDLLFVRGEPLSIAEAKELALVDTKKFFIDMIDFKHTSSIEFTNICNDIIGSAKSEISLYLSNDRYDYSSQFYLISTMRWKHLTILYYGCAITFTTLFDFIMELPNLQTFWTSLVQVEVIFENVDMIDEYDILSQLKVYKTHLDSYTCKLDSLNCLQDLHISFVAYHDYSNKIYTSALIYLITRIHSLEHINIDRDLYNFLTLNRLFFENHCPHLKKIIMRIFDKYLPRRNMSSIKIDDDGFISIPDF